MKTSDFNYDLPAELIAQTPIETRDQSRLMHLDSNNSVVKHYVFNELRQLLNEGDTLVLNDTRVIPARLHGIKIGLKNPVEVLLLKRLSLTDWEATVDPGRRLKTGAHIIFKEAVLEADIIDILDNGNRLIRFVYDGVWEEILDSLGEMPLPPYITETLEDKERYQTVYSKSEGSAAAPTAGLHFTPELIEDLRASGINIAYLTLHVGLGTFRTVSEDNIEEHPMHSEEYAISQENCDLINATREKGNRVIAVGTTSMRVLESLSLDEDGRLLPESSSTDIFIYPGYKFKLVDAMLTNFHLPQSTLLMLVSAFAGKENIEKAYETAIEEKYRFFSFGDSMFIEANTKNLIGLHEANIYT